MYLCVCGWKLFYTSSTLVVYTVQLISQSQLFEERGEEKTRRHLQTRASPTRTPVNATSTHPLNTKNNRSDGIQFNDSLIVVSSNSITVTNYP